MCVILVKSKTWAKLSLAVYMHWKPYTQCGVYRAADSRTSCRPGPTQMSDDPPTLQPGHQRTRTRMESGSVASREAGGGLW